MDRNEVADIEVEEPRSRTAVVGAIAVGALAVVATAVATIAIRGQAFLPTFEAVFDVVAGSEPGLSGPGVEASVYSSVEMRVRDAVSEARWWRAVSLASAYSIVIVGLGLVSFALWRLRTRRSFARAASWALAMFGTWVIVATTLQKVFQDQSTRSLASTLGLPTSPTDGGTWIQLPSFFISQTILLASSIGIVLIVAAVFLGRAWRMQTELDEVI